MSDLKLGPLSFIPQKHQCLGNINHICMRKPLSVSHWIRWSISKCLQIRTTSHIHSDIFQACMQISNLAGSKGQGGGPFLVASLSPTLFLIRPWCLSHCGKVNLLCTNQVWLILKKKISTKTIMHFASRSGHKLSIKQLQ